MKHKILIVISLVMVLVASGCASNVNTSDSAVQDSNANSEVSEAEKKIEQKEFDFTVDLSQIATGDVSSEVTVHDPSILKANGEYYIFGSHMSAAKSKDLTNWKKIAAGYGVSNPVYGQIYDVADKSFAYAGSIDSIIRTDDLQTHVWAPHVIYNEDDGLYYMYYCTSSTWNASNLCYGVSDKPEGPYEWKAALLYSGFTKDNIEYTDVLDYVDRDYRF